MVMYRYLLKEFEIEGSFYLLQHIGRRGSDRFLRNTIQFVQRHNLKLFQGD